MIVARNDDSKLSTKLDDWKSLDKFHDMTFSKKHLLEYCETVMSDESLLSYHNINSESIVLRDYQKEAIDMIWNTTDHINRNVIINLPTGTGKNIIITNSFINGKRYLILVPRIILMEQFASCLLSQYVGIYWITINYNLLFQFY